MPLGRLLRPGDSSSIDCRELSLLVSRAYGVGGKATNTEFRPYQGPLPRIHQMAFCPGNSIDCHVGPIEKDKLAVLMQSRYFASRYGHMTLVPGNHGSHSYERPLDMQQEVLHLKHMYETLFTRINVLSSEDNNFCIASIASCEYSRWAQVTETW